MIHSRAFRRLEYKTQVFLNGTGDHLRTRLTHTMEVAGITRNIARALRLNEDLAETIADVEGFAVRVKVGPGRAKAEYDDAARVARRTGLPLREVLADGRSPGSRWPEDTTVAEVLKACEHLR